MNYLLDTHILIWYAEGDSQLPERIRNLILDPGNTVFVSHASIWEMTIKISIGKLKVKFTLPEWEELLDKNGFSICRPEFRHFETLLRLPWHHNDPFDRILIAQGIVENYTIITRDQNFKAYSAALAYF